MAGQPARFRARIGRPPRPDLTVAALTATGGGAGRSRPAAACREHRAGAIREVARTVLPAGQAATVSGLVLGDTSTVPSATTAEFRTAGLTHLMAVSGANVTIVCGAMLLSSMIVGPSHGGRCRGCGAGGVRRSGPADCERIACGGHGCDQPAGSVGVAAASGDTGAGGNRHHIDGVAATAGGRHRVCPVGCRNRRSLF